MTKVFEPSEIYNNLSIENLPGEIWKDVTDYEGFYQVSNLGRVKSLSRPVLGKCNSIKMLPESILRQSCKKDRYLHVTLGRNGKKRNFDIHRLVAIHFVENPENKPQVNHKDGDKKNNQSTNLEWNTRIENIQHSWKIGLRNRPTGEQNGCSKLTEIDIVEIRKMRLLGMAKSDIAKYFPVNTATIDAILSGKLWNHVDCREETRTAINEVVTKARGERIGNSKLTEKDIPIIREMWSKGMTKREIANHFLVSDVNISAIVRGKTWKHVA